ncbi:putative transcription factor C2C2-GATA family [Rosa chinensis]|uniref:GATA transcription factor n=1 Tax=Rosa chinensis TaxID=74649 RepID=A0A2P6SFL2_ROSCH|nr:GATA transcription factor 4 [Rosa chinensis]PRQ57469.1 putative transcription factor C2C2-GATA family [Rosa chinensis]
MEDMYGLSSSSSSAQPHDYFPIDDLLDLSNDEIFSNSSSTTSSTDSHHHHYYTPPPPPPALFHPPSTTDFTNALCLPSEDVAELEWLSRFVDDSFSDFPAPPELSGSMSLPNDKSFSNRGHAKPIRQAEGSGSIRRCTHCASEKTPQWRTGPSGPKTLCNACGVRYKSGRLVPEYRPAASPTFVLTQHSNSHRKVMELRRQKEVSSQQESEEEEQQRRFYLHPNGFRVC